MKILVLTKYPVKGPSSRYRFHQYEASLQAAGMKLTFRSFFSQTYLDHLFGGTSAGKGYLARRFLGRFFQCLTGRKYDLVWIEGELFPFLPAWIEKTLHLFLPKRRAYDFDDAVWFRYANKRFLAKKYLSILADAAVVTVGNEYLQAYVQQTQARTLLLPTVVCGEKYQKHLAPLKGGVIGWIGSPSTVFFLERLRPVFAALSQKIAFEVHVVGAEVCWDDVAVRCFPWQEAREVDHIRAFDVGVMPLDDSDFARGKCGLKLVQYMATGVPAVASPVGVNVTFIESSGGGILAADEQAWMGAMEQLLTSATLRKSMGSKGRTWVLSHLTVEVQAPVLVAALKKTQEA